MSKSDKQDDRGDKAGKGCCVMVALVVVLRGFNLPFISWETQKYIAMSVLVVGWLYIFYQIRPGSKE
jgi:hypothetical protein